MKTTRAYETIYLSNKGIITRIEKRIGKKVGICEVEFKCTFDTASIASEAREQLSKIFPFEDKWHVFTMTNFENISKKDCFVSNKNMSVDTKTITDIECKMNEVSRMFGGEVATWEILTISKLIH